MVQVKIPEPPSFDDMIKLAALVGDLTKQVLEKEVEIKTKEAAVVRKVTTESKYFRDGKVLPMSMIESMYLYTGIEGELVPLRREYADLKGKLEKARLLFQTMQDKVKVFQTQSSNLRGTLA